MTREQVDALLFRWQVLYPSAPRLEQVEARVRLEEWLATPEIAACSMEAADEAFAVWRTRHDWPPTIHQFVELLGQLAYQRRARAREEQQMALMAEYDQTVAPPEEARQHLAKVREHVEQARRRSAEALGD